MTNVDEGMITTVGRRLAAYPPFSGLLSKDLHRVAQTLRIRYLEKGEIVFRQGDSPGEAVYLVKKGKITLFRNADAASVKPPTLVDVCDEGDLFGVRALLAQRPYGADAQAEEASLLYVIPHEELLRLMASVPSVGLFFAAGFAADSLEADGERQKAVAQARKAFRRIEEYDVLQSITPSRNVLDCSRQTSIQAAAATMSERGVGSIVVVDKDRRPVGIVTDADLRNKVVAVGRSLEDAIESIMSAPVVTVEEGVSEASLITLMLQRRLHHFVVTQDGTSDSAVVGVISEHDIWKTRGHHPTIICSEIRKASRPEELRILRDQTEDLLRSYLETETAMQLVARVVSEINDALIRRAITLSTEAMAAEGWTCPGDFCYTVQIPPFASGASLSTGPTFSGLGGSASLG
ncbi:MAG: CBS domain-containing protein [Myxococcota bacterium]